MIHRTEQRPILSRKHERCGNHSYPLSQTVHQMKRLSLLLVLLAPLASAQTFNGTLADGDPVREGGAYYDEYTFQVAENELVTVRMTGIDFDTYLTVKPPSGGDPFVNDDFDGVSISQVDFLAREGGIYTVQASGYSAGLTGDYEVVVTSSGVADVQTMEGRLVPGDEQALKGEYFDEFDVQGDSNGRISFELLSYGFDGFLVVQSPSGRMYRNDDAMGSAYMGGHTRLSRIEATSDENGMWTVYVTSLSEGEVGAYDLRIIRSD